MYTQDGMRRIIVDEGTVAGRWYQVIRFMYRDKETQAWIYSPTYALELGSGNQRGRWLLDSLHRNYVSVNQRIETMALSVHPKAEKTHVKRAQLGVVA